MTRQRGQALFDAIALELLTHDGVERGRMFASDGLRASGRLFAFVGGSGGLIVKLPPDVVAELLASGAAERVELGGRRMREWLEVPIPAGEAGTAEWRRLLDAAEGYAVRLSGG